MSDNILFYNFAGSGIFAGVSENMLVVITLMAIAAAVIIGALIAVIIRNRRR